MAGHSHAANVRRTKEAGDARRGKIFSKVARNIMNAARVGGGDPSMNLNLKYAIERARAVSMPKDNIERAIRKGTGELDGGKLETCTYEAIGPGGVFLMIEVLTDNRNRTASEIRKTLDLKNAHLGNVAWAFEKKGVLTVSANGVSEEDLLDLALEAGAEDLERVGKRFMITTPPSEFEHLRSVLGDKNIIVEDAQLCQVAKNDVKVDRETCRKLLELFDQLDDNDDVQNVYSNLDVPDDLLSAEA